MTYSSLGKQVLLNDAHFADARDPDAAALIARALALHAVSAPPRVPVGERYSMRQGDDETTDVFEGNKRVGYVDRFDLYGFGADGFRHWICAVTDNSEVPLKLAQWIGSQRT